MSEIISLDERRRRKATPALPAGVHESDCAHRSAGGLYCLRPAGHTGLHGRLAMVWDETGADTLIIDLWTAARDKIRAEYVAQYADDGPLDLLRASSHLMALAGKLAAVLSMPMDGLFLGGAAAQAASHKIQVAVFYAQVSLIWRNLGIGTFAAFDEAVTAAVGDAESRPPRAPVAWRLASMAGDVGQVADLATCWWGASLDDYRAQIEPVFANLGCKVRELWTVLR